MFFRVIAGVTFYVYTESVCLMSIYIYLQVTAGYRFEERTINENAIMSVALDVEVFDALLM